ncbi:Peptidoglycan/xylan/chitin deacetylase, PgdA/CDA1 family [Actinomyces ruminicola]|uniref:Peptidoglycan/xylan/chitin deacetylase, PgdA/CDA1 family n=1 Tax=Actinomyces ruminicola TaxID=332524 RepID=A0A1H0FDG2_9ACTO|nr:polysaccharide deacetylase family protein [Actinomyces ruminicola]SDN92469.1 Peptidoglycan/xylan/chitin deacetylase, PgdA/CDA1 family [Actinomyces ruminicola]
MKAKTLLRRPADALLGPALGSVMSVRTRTPQVILTFDDGPLPGSTEPLAAVLAAHDAHATFFMLLTRARRSPGLVQELVRAGHEIALHGMDHRRVTTLRRRELTPWLRDARAELEDIAGVPVRWFRPPHGAQSPRSRLAAAAAGLSTVLWSGTTWDWKDVTHQERVARAMRDAVPGAILLAHDGAADACDLADEEPAAGVDKVALLTEVLTGLRARDLRAVALGPALAAGRPVRRLSFSR